MQRSVLALLLLVAMTGCAKKDESSGTLPAERRNAESSERTKYLAYEHAISIETEETKVAAVFEVGQAACQEAAAESCVVLESHVAAGRNASASLKFRAKPSGIQKLIAVFAKQGEIATQSTTAEDLASPIEDASKKLAMLNDYRSKLEALLGRARNDVDALIKLNRELAQVQSDLETVTGKHVHLMQRVETETLTVSIASNRRHSFWQPIAASVSDFGLNLSQGISATITGIAYLIPWGIALLAASWAARRLWHRKRHLRAGI